MSIEKVREYFRELGIDDRIKEFDVSSATVELAAKAAGDGACKDMQDNIVSKIPMEAAS